MDKIFVNSYFTPHRNQLKTDHKPYIKAKSIKFQGQNPKTYATLK